jgi:uncharacterized protein (TIGR02646 family)
MRPVVRGARPKNDADEDVQYDDYAQARGELIRRLGEYCSYCEMHLDSSLAVEHVQPKQLPGAAAVDQARALDWDNFLLACTNCNSIKGSLDVDLAEYLWPDRDNTYNALKYSEGGIVSVADNLPQDLEAKAKKIIKLVGLDRMPNTEKASDRRWLNRKESWEIAQLAKKRLTRNDNQDFRDQIIETAQAKGFWSIWKTVFKDDADMSQKLIQVFPGTCTGCFDAQNGYSPVARTGGQC